MREAPRVLLAAFIGLVPTAGAIAQEIKPRTTSTYDRLPAPSPITASQQADGSIRVVWSAVDGAVRYSLTRSVPPTAAALVTLPGSPDTVYVDRDVKPGSTYYYLVGAVNEAGITGLKVSAAPVTAKAIASDTTARTDTASTPVLTAPTNVVARPYPYMEPTVTWQSTESRARFLVERRVPQTDPNAGWKQVIESNRLPGLWKCCVAHDINPPEDQNLVYRVTAVDTVTPTVKSQPALSNVIVNWKIKIDPPVLRDTVLTIGASGRFFLGPNQLKNVQWVSVAPYLATVEVDYGIVKAVAQGVTYIVASGLTPVGGVQSYIWRLTINP